MAVYPCDIGAHRYAGPQRSAYITSCQGRDTSTRVLRLCAQHYGAITDVTDANMQLLGEEQTQVRMVCTCGKDREVIVFVKLFDRDSDPIEYVADVCAAHHDALLAMLSAPSGRPL